MRLTATNRANLGFVDKKPISAPPSAQSGLSVHQFDTCDPGGSGSVSWNGQGIELASYLSRKSPVLGIAHGRTWWW